MSFFREFHSEIKILVVAGFAALVFVVGAILLLRETPPAPVEEPTVNNQQSAIDTSSWRTYRNDEFGFEVQYPAGLHVLDSEDAAEFHAVMVMSDLSFPVDPENSPEEFFIATFTLSDLSIEDFLQFKKEEQQRTKNSYEDYGPQVQTDISRVSFGIISGYKMVTDVGPNKFTDITWFFPHENIPKILMVIKGTFQGTKREVESKQFDQILATFRFVDSLGAQEENVVEVDLGKGNYADLGLERGSYKDEACKRLLGYDADWKGCEELQIVNAQGWRVVRFVFMSEIAKPFPYYENKQAHSLGLFYENHYFEMEVDTFVTNNTKIKIIPPKNVFASLGPKGGTVSSDVVSLQLQQPIWYPNQGKLPSPQLQKADFMSTFEIEVPKTQLINGASPVSVKATFTDGTVKEDSVLVGEILSEGYILSTATNVRSSFDKNMLSNLAQTDITNFITYGYNGDIYRTDLEKTETTQLTAHKGIWSLKVAPDQKYIAYVEERGVESHPGAVVYFFGSVYLKIIDAQDGKLIWSFPIELQEDEGYGTLAPYVNFFWDADGSRVYLSIGSSGRIETSYLLYNIQTREKKLLNEDEFKIVRGKYEKINGEEEKKLTQSAKELLAILQFPAEYDSDYAFADRRFYVSPNGKKIAFLLLPHVCTYGYIIAPLIVYDTETQIVFVADGPRPFGPTFGVRWVNNDNLLFANRGIMTRIDFTKRTISPFLRDNWTRQENQCHEPGPTVDSLCDQDVEFLYSYPFLQDYCSA